MAKPTVLRGLNAGRRVRCRLFVPGDKSISHRAALMGAIAEGQTVISNYAPGQDCATTLCCISQLGVRVTREGSTVEVTGVGSRLSEPADVLSCGNSGTTMRLLSGILAGQEFLSVLTGDESLRARPMKRVIEPLRHMGATLDGRTGGERAPIVIRGQRLSALPEYRMTGASAQVKSCVMLAALFAGGTTTIIEPAPSRDHTERMLPLFGASLVASPGRVTLQGGQALHATQVRVPGDVSSAAFWLALGAMMPGAEVTVSSVGLNPLRTGFIDVMRSMGCELRTVPSPTGFEPVGDISVEARSLKAIEIGPEIVPSLVDEIPVLAVVAAMAEGTTVIRGAEELRHKESDRIAMLVKNLGAMGVKTEETRDGLVIEGSGRLSGAHIQTGGDHRIAMAFCVAALVARGETVIDDTSCIDISYPGFMDIIRRLSREGEAMDA